MNVLVTGGTGFVGSHLVEALRADGHHVRALVRASSDDSVLTSAGAQPFVGDLEDPATLAGVCRDCDVVYHAAARVDLVGSDAEFHRTTVAGTEALVRAARDAGVRRFVYVGSCAVYHPDMLLAGEIRENTPIRTPPPWFRYGRAKLAAEAVVQREAAAPMEWVILRLGYLYGSRNRAMRQYLFPVLRRRFLGMKFIGKADNPMAMIHVSDAVRAIVRAGCVPAAAGEILIAAGTERVTQRQYFDALTDGLHLPRIRRRLPYWLAFSLATLAEYVPIYTLGGLFQRASIALTGLPQRINCEYTQKLLDWKPQMRFADGMREACEWFHRQYPVIDAEPHRQPERIRVATSRSS